MVEESLTPSIDSKTEPGSIENPVILGIVGNSTSGKTTLTDGIVKILGPERVTVICVDDYHAFDRAQRAAKGLSALEPAANHILRPTISHRDLSTPRGDTSADGVVEFANKSPGTPTASR